MLWRPRRTGNRLERLRDWLLLRPLSDPRLRGRSARRQCTNSDCRRPLPANSDRVDSYVVGLVGPSGASKTHLLATMLDQLAGLAGMHGLAVEADQDTRSRMEEDYRRPLLRELRVLPPTAPGPSRPLLWEVRPGAAVGRPFNLAMYDASGDELADEEQAADHHYLARAAGLIFVVDPWSLPEVAARVPPALPPARRTSIEATVSLLHRVAEWRSWLSGGDQGHPVRSPVAIVIGKADLLRQAANAMGMKPEFLGGPGAARPAWTPQMGRDIERFVGELGGQAIVEAARRYGRRAFHVAAATGRRPTLDGRYPYLAPSGCLEPLRWLLHELHVRAA